LPALVQSAFDVQVIEVSVMHDDGLVGPVTSHSVSPPLQLHVRSQVPEGQS